MTLHMKDLGARAAAEVQISSAAVNRDLGPKNTPPWCGGQAGWRSCGGGICECLKRQIEAEPAAARPIPAFTTLASEAESWATFASDAALKVYVAAAVARLSSSDRAGLAAYLARTAE